MAPIAVHAVLVLQKGTNSSALLIIECLILRFLLIATQGMWSIWSHARLVAVQYVGRTTRRLRDRLNDHIGNIDRKQTTYVARHFNHVHGGDTSLLQIQGIEKINTSRGGGNKFRILCEREVFWIFSLNHRIPQGLNFEWDLTHFYDWLGYRNLGIPYWLTYGDYLFYLLFHFMSSFCLHGFSFL